MKEKAEFHERRQLFCAISHHKFCNISLIHPWSWSRKLTHHEVIYLFNTLGGSKESISASEALGKRAATVRLSFFRSAPDRRCCDFTSAAFLNISFSFLFWGLRYLGWTNECAAACCRLRWYDVRGAKESSGMQRRWMRRLLPVLSFGDSSCVYAVKKVRANRQFGP